MGEVSCSGEPIVRWCDFAKPSSTNAPCAPSRAMTALLPPSSHFMRKICARTRIHRRRLVHLVEDEAVADPDVRDRLNAGRLGGRVAGCNRDRVEVVLRGDRVAADPEVVDSAAEALRDPGGDHRDERHEREPDHQRGRGGGRPLGVPPRVVARQRARCAAEPARGRAERPGERPHEPDCQERDSDEDQQRADAHEEEDLLRSESVAEQAEDQQGESGHRQQRRADRPVLRKARPAAARRLPARPRSAAPASRGRRGGGSPGR